MASRPAIFFDRDNTLLACDGYLGDPAGVALVNGAADAVARARALGFATVVVSNQSGVARGMFEEEAVHAVNQRFEQALLEQNDKAVIDQQEFCPYHPEATVEKYKCDSDLRKPKPGMLLKAARDLDLDLEKSWLIGDSPRDIEAGKAAGCKTILFVDPALTKSPAAEVATSATPDHAVASLQEALDIIESALASSPSGGEAPPLSLSPLEGRGQGRGVDRPEATGATSPSDVAALTPHPNPLPHGEREPGLARLESHVQEILVEMRKRNEQVATDFSVSKLLAGIVQVLVLAVLFFAYINRTANTQTIMLVALTLQAMTISLLIMGRQR